MTNDSCHLNRLIAFDKKMAKQFEASDKNIIVIGTDEVGRGCLAGPVVAAAVSLPKFRASSKFALRLSQLNDSKQLNPELREELSQALKEIAHYSIGEASPQEIDEINILHASLLAMKRAVLALIEKIEAESEILLLIDGNKTISKMTVKQITVIKGDGLSAAIAAASVIAKVHRDQIMTNLAKEHPQYNWHENKGYASRHHRKALETHGPSFWHRRSFNLCPPKQLSLFANADEQTED